MIVERTQTLERGWISNFIANSRTASCRELARGSGLWACDTRSQVCRSFAQISLLKIQDCEVSRGKTTPSLSRSSSSDVPSPSALLRRLGCAHGFAQ